MSKEKLERLYEQALLKWGFNWLPTTPTGTFLESFDVFKQMMQNRYLYDKVIKELNQNR